MAMDARENWLRTVEFAYPAWIPCQVVLSPLTWKVYREDLEEIVLAYPRIFPEYKRGAAPGGGRVDFDEMPVVYREGETYRDSWGCLWYNIQGGLEGQVVEHPLADWEAMATYRPPDPLRQAERGERNWARAEREIAERKAKGLLTWGNAERLFDRLYFLRGFNNLMRDFADEPVELSHLIEMIEEYETALIKRWLEIGVDAISFHTDIGTQRSLMISPASFRKYIKPMFKRLFRMCRDAGTHVLLSSDGRLLDIVDDLIECGVSVHDPQLRANTLKGIVRAYKYRLCAKVDLDRQAFPFMSRADIRRQISEVVAEMRCPEGGVMLLASIHGADVPLKTIEAICEAMVDYGFH